MNTAPHVLAIALVASLALAGCSTDSTSPDLPDPLAAIPEGFAAVRADVVDRALGEQLDLSPASAFESLPSIPWAVVKPVAEDRTLDLQFRVSGDACPAPSAVVVREDDQGIYIQVIFTTQSPAVGCAGSSAEHSAHAVIPLTGTAGERTVFAVEPR